MATIIWPSIPASYFSSYGFSGGKRIPVDLQSGGRYSVTASTTPRYRVVLHYIGLRTDKFAPTPYADRSEAIAIRDCIMALQRGDVAQIADPSDGTSRLWEIDDDGFTDFGQTPESPWFYEAEIALRSKE